MSRKHFSQSERRVVLNVLSLGGCFSILVLRHVQAPPFCVSCAVIGPCSMHSWSFCLSALQLGSGGSSETLLIAVWFYFSHFLNKKKCAFLFFDVFSHIIGLSVCSDDTLYSSADREQAESDGNRGERWVDNGWIPNWGWLASYLAPIVRLSVLLSRV